MLTPLSPLVKTHEFRVDYRKNQYTERTSRGVMRKDTLFLLLFLFCPMSMVFVEVKDRLRLKLFRAKIIVMYNNNNNV